MIDAQAIKERLNLQAIIEVDIGPARRGRWHCPWCQAGGGRSLPLSVHENGYKCFGCGKTGDVITWLKERRGLSWNDIVNLAEIEPCELQTTDRRQRMPEPTYTPPALDWQDDAWNAITICHAKLSEIGPAIDYLLSRGLCEHTWRQYTLGWSPGANFGRLYVPRGLVIPCIVVDTVWSLKIALLPGDPVKCSGCGHPAQARMACPTCGAMNRYRGVKGNRPAAIFGANNLRGFVPALFCEGEFDTMTAWQECADLVEPATSGSAMNHLDLATWGAYLLRCKMILLAYDQDAAGERGSVWWDSLSNRVKHLVLPAGVKDINDLLTKGGDLRDWLVGELDRLSLACT